MGRLFSCASISLAFGFSSVQAMEIQRFHGLGPVQITIDSSMTQAEGETKAKNLVYVTWSILNEKHQYPTANYSVEVDVFAKGRGCYISFRDHDFPFAPPGMFSNANFQCDNSGKPVLRNYLVPFPNKQAMPK